MAAAMHALLDRIPASRISLKPIKTIVKKPMSSSSKAANLIAKPSSRSKPQSAQRKPAAKPSSSKPSLGIRLQPSSSKPGVGIRLKPSSKPAKPAAKPLQLQASDRSAGQACCQARARFQALT